ncbi:MAG: glycolate oxidase subunit GlcE [Lautropia sp.]|nr:glycolate oxidase subunit GlcE [Lautropia sp.]
MSSQQGNREPRARTGSVPPADDLRLPGGITSVGADPDGSGTPAVDLSMDEAAAHEMLARMRNQLGRSYRAGRPIRLRGGDTHRFYGNPWPERCDDGVMLDCRLYRGVVHYDPSELVVTVRCGTPLAELEAVLAREGQCLPFEPPHFAPGGTVGGMVATGLSGPRRLSMGAVRDFVLGTVLVSPGGEVMRFGGEVMKNVAGYDVSRLLVGSMGVLGMIAEVSLKVLPQPKADQTLVLDMTEVEAIRRCNQWGGLPLPLAATLWHEGRLWVRLCGAEQAVESAVRQLGGELLPVDEAAALWLSIRNQRHAHFWQPGPLWRLSVPATVEVLGLPGSVLTEWGGALRWYVPPVERMPSADVVREAVERVGGTATLFRADEAHAAVARFHPLAPANRQIQQRLKQVFDPAGLINPGRLYDWL